MYVRLFGPQTSTYWTQKSTFGSELPNPETVILWPEAQRALERLPCGQRRFWVKFSTGFLGTGKKLWQRGYQDHTTCPRCGQPNEDNIHVLQCTQAQATAKWNGHVASLSLTLTQYRAPREITTAIVHNLRAWHDGLPPIIPHTNTWGERDATLAQCSLGWNNFVFGRWHQLWASAQARYLQSLGLPSGTRRWVTAIIYKLQMTAWDLWDHRNQILHAPGGPRETTEHSHLDTLIRGEYHQGLAHISAMDRSLFQRPLHQLLTSTLPTKRRWLQSAQLSRQRTLTENQNARATLHRQQAFMRGWLVRPHAPPP